MIAVVVIPILAILGGQLKQVFLNISTVIH
jgi:Flp pilus assembly pilin Flp